MSETNRMIWLVSLAAALWFKLPQIGALSSGWRAFLLLTTTAVSYVVCSAIAARRERGRGE